MKRIVGAVAAMGLWASSAYATNAGSRVTLPSGKKIFVSGMNLAWINYAGDVGDAPLSASTIARMDAAFAAVRDSGGNTMRVWLSTDGTNDPKYTKGYVWGPGASTIANVQTMLQLAKKHQMLLLPVLLTHNWVNKGINPTILANNKTMLTTDSGLAAYTKNYLTPLVTTIGNDPNLLAWEVFNEPEGMVDGWSSPAGTISQEQVQKAVNRIAGTIRRLVPGVLVSNGAASMRTVNWYTDAALIAAGGDSAGVMDFYMAHYYGWNGVSNSPFRKNYAAWNFDKPLVIGEYASSNWSTSTASSSKMQDAGKVDTLMGYLNRAGYAGGLGWQYQPDAGDPWMKGFATFGHSMRVAYLADSNSIKLDGTSNGTFAVSVAAGLGGLVRANPVGRIDSTKSVTIVATPLAGYSFAGWSGDTVATSPSLTITKVVRDWALQANFVPDAGTDLLKDGDFANTTNWGFYAAAGNTSKVDFAQEKATVTNSVVDTLGYHIQLSQTGIPVEVGATYTLTFEASATVARSLEVAFSGGAPDWEWLGGGTVDLGTSLKQYSLDIKALGTSSSAILQFNLGGSKGVTVLDNVHLFKSSTSALRSAPSNSAQLRVQVIGNAVLWQVPQTVGPARVRLLDLKGRELSRANVASGQTQGSLPLVGQGVRLVRWETAQGALVRVIAPVP